MESSNSSNKAVIAIVVVVLLVVAATAVIVLGNNKPSTDSSLTASDTPASVSPSSSTSSVPSNATFKDGTYSATGSYQTPGGVETIGVQVTLSGGTITDASVTPEGKTGEAQEFQSAFVSGFKTQVVGKKITEVSLSRVAGSSLTPNGFNSAINDIEKQAQA